MPKSKKDFFFLSPSKTGEVQVHELDQNNVEEDSFK